jgi:predicted ribosomally synthesized peptide with nif11-like leader
MSLQTAKQFIMILETDPALQAKIQRAGGTHEAAIQFAAQLGLQFTFEEFLVAQDKLWGDLSPQDLKSFGLSYATSRRKLLLIQIDRLLQTRLQR